ncbi:MAG: hypothetical protein JWQ72_2284, partial [Polaromonas sp.]|nr:hypothetical protein [Polaromonas sp.]
MRREVIEDWTTFNEAVRRRQSAQDNVHPVAIPGYYVVPTISPPPMPYPAATRTLIPPATSPQALGAPAAAHAVPTPAQGRLPMPVPTQALNAAGQLPTPVPTEAPKATGQLPPLTGAQAHSALLPPNVGAGTATGRSPLSRSRDVVLLTVVINVAVLAFLLTWAFTDPWRLTSNIPPMIAP